MAGVALYLAGLDLAQMDHAFLSAHDDRAHTRDHFAPAGFHVAEHDRAGLPELYDFSGSDVVHELGAGHFSLHVLDDSDRRLRCSQSRKTNQRDKRGKHGLHPGNLAVSKATIWQDCYNK